MRTKLHDNGASETVDAARLEAFSDGVIAIVVTIMVLELHAPERGEAMELLHLWPTFAAYVLSFALVSVYWVNHHQLFKLARRVGRETLWYNVNFLFWLSIFPFATAWIGNTRGDALPVGFYALLSLVVASSYYFLSRNLQARNAHVDALGSDAQRQRRKNVLALALTASAIPTAFIWEPAALLLLALPVLLYIVPDQPVREANQGGKS